MLHPASSMLRERLTADFVKSRSRLSWREIAFGLEESLLAPAAPVWLAVDAVMREPSPNATLSELAALNPNNHLDAIDLVKALAALEPALNEEDVRRKWLYLLLAWLYEHKEEFIEPLAEVETIYCDFGHPAEIEHFISYMPGDEPNLGSLEANQRRLYERWKQYIDAAAESYGAGISR